MASSTLAALAAAAALDGTELLYVDQGGADKKLTTLALVTAMLGSTALSGATVVTSKPLINQAQTWNDAAVTFSGWKLNVTKTAAGDNSLLMDLQIGGVPYFQVGSFVNAGGGESTSGGLRIPIGNTRRTLLGFGTIGVNSTGFSSAAGGRLGVVLSNADILEWVSGLQVFRNDWGVGWSSTADPEDTPDCGFKRNAAGVVKVTDGGAGIGKILTTLPTSDPGITGAMWNNAGTVAFSA